MTPILRRLEDIGTGDVAGQRLEDMDAVTFRRSGNCRFLKLWSSEDLILRDTEELKSLILELLEGHVERYWQC